MHPRRPESAVAAPIGMHIMQGFALASTRPITPLLFFYFLIYFFYFFILKALDSWRQAGSFLINK
jgi:hypothetical protein